MKSPFQISLIALILFFLVPFHSLTAQWSIVQNITPNQSVDVVWATSANTVFAMSDDKLLNSANGGQTWQQQDLSPSTSPFTPEDIHFFDAQNGMIVGDRFVVLGMSYTTHDGGQTWHEAIITGPGSIQMEAVRMVSPSVAFAAGWYGALFKTVDGGNSWNAFSIPGATAHWNDMDFPDPQHGWLLSNDNKIYGTSDGGTTWQSLPMPADAFPSHFQFLDAQNGFMIGAGGLYKTVDGALNWTKVTDYTAGLSSLLYFKDMLHGWSASDGNLYKTNDGGQSWLKQFDENSNPALQSIHFSGTTGWAVGSRSNGTGVLYKAANNGGFGVALVPPQDPPCYFEPAIFKCLHDGATTFNWYVNDVSYGINSSVFEFTPWFDGSYEVYCTAWNANQTIRTETYQMYVYTDPILPFNGTVYQDSICRGSAIDVELSVLYSGRQYRIQSGNDILAEITGNGQPTLTWNSGPLDTTTTFDFYALFTDCPGWKKMNSVTVHVVDAPDLTLPVDAASSVICQNAPLSVQIQNTGLNIQYQIWSNGVPVSDQKLGNSSVITLTAKGLTENTTLNIVASASSFCLADLNKALPVTVQKVDPTFAISTHTLGLGEPLTLENTSADSLTFQWEFIEGASNVTSLVRSPAPVAFNQPGTANIRLIGISPHSCRDTVQTIIKLVDLSALNGDWALPVLVNGKTIEMDSFGNIYGYSFGKTELLDRAAPGVTTLQGISGAFYKYDKRGVLQWSNTYNDNDGIPLGARVYDQTTDKQGNSYFMVNLIGVSQAVYFSSTDGRGVQTTKKDCWSLLKYSPNGVLNWVRFIEPVDAQGHTVVSLSFYPISVTVDTAENIFITSYLNNTQYPRYLVLSSPDAYLDTIEIDANYSFQYLIKVSEKNSFGWVNKFYDEYQFFNFVGPYSGAIVKPDQKGGCYLTMNGGVTQSLSLQIVHFDASGQVAWKQRWGGGEANGTNNYAWANDLQFDRQGNLYLLGSASGISDYIGTNIVSAQPGVFIIKISPQGKIRWARAFRQAPYVSQSWNPYGIGLAMDNDRLHMLCEVQMQKPEVFTYSQCFDSTFADNHSLFWTTWDTLGNLLQVKAADIFEPSGQSPSAVSGRFKAFNGRVYLLGNLYKSNGGNFWTASLPANQNSRRFLAAISDPKDYIPYINNCYLQTCVLDPTGSFQISYLFSDIQWYKNNQLMPGYNAPVMSPPDSAVYSVIATNPIGIVRTSPVPSVADILPVPNTTLTQMGADLVANYHSSNIYYFYDSSGQELSVNGNGVFTPPQTGWYSVRIDGLESCDAIGIPYFFDATHSSVTDPGNPRFVLAPNPTSGFSSLQLPNPAPEALTLQIFDARGALMATLQVSTGTTEIRIDAGAWLSGLYLLNLSGDHEPMGAGRLIKQW